VSEPDDAVAILDRCVAGLGGDDRPGQRRLTEVVAAAIGDRHHLVAEAPTGSGKSLAYLSAVAASGVRAVVATATLTLQDQLWRKDLPLVQEHGGVEIEGALLKGRANYVCLAKLDSAKGGDALFDERPGPDFARDLERLEEFSADSETGDVADLPASIEPRSWRAVTCGPNECPGANRCNVGVECFAEQARARATEAAIVVVNHALYAAHLGSGGKLLPEHDVVIIDEAHAFDRFATGALSAEVTAGGLRQLAGRLRRAGAEKDETDGVAEVAERLDDWLEDVDGRFDPTADGFAQLLVRIDARITAAMRSVDRDAGSVQAQAVRLALSRVEAVRRFQAPNRDDVTWVEGGERPVLRLAPIEIGERLAPVLFEETPVVLVSATLGPGTRFDPLARRLGLDPGAPRGSEDDPDEEDDRPGLGYDARRFESPFDLRDQAILYVPRDLPDVRADGWADAAAAEVCGLVDAAGGRTLLLCTSWRNVHAFTDVLREKTDHRVLAQGDDTTARLVDEFATDQASCLVATRAFWQGLDVPGVSCVLVVIDRLPFTRPDDPLEQAQRRSPSTAP
jgi:ATP-dependent DNA helicase DinG